MHSYQGSQRLQTHKTPQARGGARPSEVMCHNRNKNARNMLHEQNYKNKEM